MRRNSQDEKRLLHARERQHEAREREKVAQDLAFEKEYVMIEKRAVVVNAFADELDASPHLASRNRQASNQHGTMVRRVTSQGMPTSVTGAQPATPSSELQAATGRRLDQVSQRQPSYERRYAPSSSSPNHMLAQVLNAANARIFGRPSVSPPVGMGASPPRTLSAYPAYPAPSLGLAITEGKDSNVPLDEDNKVLRTVEDAANRSDTVYHFAEVKYKQLLPATPSADEGPGFHQIGALERPMRGSGEGDDDDLTQLAVVAVSEEALVLYVKALAILVKAIELASCWWAQQRHHDNGLDYASRSAENRSSATEVGKKMNGVVQWARNRFNECMEKSEIVGRRLVEAQKQLPSDQAMRSDRRAEDVPRSSSGNNISASGDTIQLTSGVTAEKLMFDRAVEMSRAAAVNELVGEGLEDCKVSYRTAITLLEAVLESDEEPLMPRPSADTSKPADELVNGMEKEDRKTVVSSKSGGAWSWSIC